MIINDKICEEDVTNCALSDLEDVDNTYDFTEEVYTTCEALVSDPE
ncbi:hypothetical protein ACFLY2_00765 [Patescibacteria group bacterium]